MYHEHNASRFVRTRNERKEDQDQNTRSLATPHWLVFFIVALLSFTVRALVPLLLPTALRKVAGIYHLNCTYDRFELNIFSGDAGIWGIKVVPNEGGPAILEAEYCHGNVSVLGLFKGQLNVWRVEADGVDVNIDRNPDGHIPLLDRFVSSTSSATTGSTPVVSTAAGPSKPIDLASPVRVDALRLGHIRVHLHDRGVTPEVDTDLAMDLRLSDLGSTTSPAKFELNMSADPILDSLRITGKGTSGGKTLNADLTVLARGIRLKPAAGYLQPLGIVPMGDSITLAATGHVHTAPAPGNAEGFTGSMAFDHLSATSDGVEAMALDQFLLTADTIDTKSIRLGKLLITGARATAGRAPDGHLSLAGIELDPTAVAKPQPTHSASAGTAQGPPAIVSSIMAEPWSLGEATINNARMDLHDQGIAPEVHLSLVAEQLSAKNINHNPSDLNTTVALSGMLHAPGMIKNIQLTGAAQPFADTKTLSATVAASGIRLDSIKPYLDQAGLESQLKEGTFTAAMNASFSIARNGDLSADATIGKVRFADQTDLLSFNGMKIAGVLIAPATGRVGVRSIEMSGPQIVVAREKNGEFASLGLRTKPCPAAAVVSAPVASATPVATHFTITSLPQVTINRFIWKDIRLDLTDQTATPPVAVSLSDVGVEINNFSTELNAAGNAAPGHIHAWLDAPGIANKLELNGNLAPRATGMDFAADINGSGITLASLSPYLKPLGIESMLRDGSIQLHTTAQIQQTTGGLTASVGADHLKYMDGTTELAGLDNVAVSNVSLINGALNVDAVNITRPRAIARREANGSLVAGGIRLLPIKTASAKPTTTAAPLAAQNAATTASVSPLIPFVVMVKHVAVEDSSINWADLAVQPAAEITAGATVHLDDFVYGRSAPPATVTITAHADGAADHCAVNGTVSVGPDAQSAVLDVSATGLRAGPLASYFPPGISASLQQGQFHTTITATVSKNTAGGLAAALKIGPVDFRDADEQLFKLDAMSVIAPRIDLPDNVLAVDEISVTGLETHAEKMPDGTLHAMGLVLGGTRVIASPTAMAPPTPSTVLPVIASMVEPVAVTLAAPPLTVAEILAASHKTLPLITVEKLDLNVTKLTLADLSRPESAPLIVSDLRLHNANRIEWLGKDASAKPPTHLQFTCRIDPVIDNVQVDAMVSPFAKNPHLTLDFAANGVRGDGLTGLVPELKPQINGANLTKGSLVAHLEAEAKLDRRSPIDFDVSRGFDLSFALDKVYYRAEPGGEVLAGVDEVQSDNIRIQPTESIVHVKRLEISKPIGMVTIDDRGVHLLGWVLKLPKAKLDTSSTQPAGTVTITSSNQPPVISPQPATVAVKPKGEVRIDRLLISGLDAQFNDYAVTPPLMIPLNGLDVEVKNFSTLAPYEDLPIRFSAIVNAGKVRLRKHGATSSGITSLLGGAAKLVGAKPIAKPVEMEDRDLFAQITASGEISLYPKLHGWAKTSVNGLDLTALEGPAREAGLTLSDGFYDSDVNVRFNPDGSIAADSKFVLTDLSLSEPPNGPIARFLKLPAPLDVAIGAVQGADGSVSLPIDVEVDPKHISYSDVGLAAAGGISKVLVTAIASAPLKAVNDVGSLVGLGGDKKQSQTTTITVPFQAGSIALDSSSAQVLNVLLRQLKKDPSLMVTVRHQLGDRDVARAAERANPTIEQCDSLQEELRNRKVTLLNLRADTAGTARAELMSKGATAAEPTLQQLRAIDRELAGVEDSLDQVCDLLRPGADNRADRRTRAAALQIAGVRVAEVKASLLAAGLPNIKDRLKVIDPRFDPSNASGAVVITAVQMR